MFCIFCIVKCIMDEVRKFVRQQLFLPTVLNNIIMEYYVYVGDVINIHIDDNCKQHSGYYKEASMIITSANEIHKYTKRYFIDKNVLYIMTINDHSNKIIIETTDIFTNKKILTKEYDNKGALRTVVYDGSFIIKNNILYGIVRWRFNFHAILVFHLENEINYVINTSHDELQSYTLNSLKINGNNITVYGSIKNVTIHSHPGEYNVEYVGLVENPRYISFTFISTELVPNDIKLIDKFWALSRTMVLDIAYKSISFREIKSKLLDERPSSVFLGEINNKMCIMLLNKIYDKTKISLKIYDIITNKLVVENIICNNEIELVCIWGEQLISIHKNVQDQKNVNLYYILYE